MRWGNKENEKEKKLTSLTIVHSFTAVEKVKFTYCNTLIISQLKRDTSFHNLFTSKSDLSL
ncbi:hypothetical protein Hanom_Chr12g01114271 [Helianthus anomalus]